MSNADVETFMTTAHEAATGEWWWLFGCTLVILTFLVMFSYYQFSKSIWVAKQKNLNARAKKLGTSRHMVAGILVILAVVFLVALKLYKKPVNVHKELEAYNINLIAGVQEGEDELREKGNITLDIVVRKRVFKPDEVTGMVLIEGEKYVSFYGGSENEDGYSVIFSEEGYGFIRHDVILDISKDMEMYVIYAKPWGSSGFIAPAGIEAEAREMYERFYDTELSYTE